MKTVVDSHDISTNEVKFNSDFLEFAKNASFKPIACKPYRPCTKGLVENVAKIMDRLDAFNEEFLDYDELKQIVITLNKDLNEEICQSTNEKPINRFLEKEKEYLNRINIDQFNFKSNLPVRKVDISSMINYNNCKYSVPPELIGNLVSIDKQANQLYIYYSGKEVACHNISSVKVNYREEDLKQILPSVFPHASASEIEKMAQLRLKGLDIKHNKKE